MKTHIEFDGGGGYIASAIGGICTAVFITMQFLEVPSITEAAIVGTLYGMVSYSALRTDFANAPGGVIGRTLLGLFLPIFAGCMFITALVTSCVAIMLSPVYFFLPKAPKAGG